MIFLDSINAHTTNAVQVIALAAMIHHVAVLQPSDAAELDTAPIRMKFAALIEEPVRLGTIAVGPIIAHPKMVNAAVMANIVVRAISV